MSTPDKKRPSDHFSANSLFNLARAKHDAHAAADDYQSVAAWFLGPKGENEALLTSLVNDSIHEHALYRSTHYKKGDPPYIDEEIKASAPYKRASANMKDIRALLSEKLHGSVPFFSLRYQAHMNWDTVLPANVGYITAMLYNQNNVATEGGPETCALEKEVGQQLCNLVGFGATSSWGHITADGTIANIEAMWVARNLKFYPLAIQRMLLTHPDKDNALEPARAGLTVQTYPGKGQIVNKRLVQCSTWELLNLDGDAIVDLPNSILKLCPALTQSALDSYLTPLLVQNRGLTAYAAEYPETANLRVFVPATRHYSWPKAGTLLGLGQKSVVGIPVDGRCRMDLAQLDPLLLECAQLHIPVLSCVAVIGSTEEGAVDDLNGLLQKRQSFKLSSGLNALVHCDAAWGGYLRTMLVPPGAENAALAEDDSGFVPSLPLSVHAQRQYRLLSQADTLTVDPHKAGFVPYPAGALCYRNGLMRYLITVDASYIHSNPDTNMGIFGVEGSKPGATAAAVWTAHKAIPLNQSGYGQILGECSFTAKLYYCYWVTLATEADDFGIEPLIPLPDALYGKLGNVLATGKAEILTYIRKHIIGKTNDELMRDPDVLSVLQQVGSDVLINTFAVNFKRNNQWNQDIASMKKLNDDLFTKFSITTPEQALKGDVDFILTDSTIDTPNYTVALRRVLGSFGIPMPKDCSMTFLINTILQPWPTTHGFIQTIMSAFRKGVEECIRKIPATVATARAMAVEAAPTPDLVAAIPGDSTPQPARWFPLKNAYAGYAVADATKRNRLFYWFFETQGKATADTPLIIWLNGGPGASSLAGLFLENGPFTVKSDASIAPNPFSWNAEAHLLFWDQPVGTGFSTTDTGAYVKTEEEMALQLVNALVNFYTLHPEYRTNPLYITGESYAGKYIPYIGQEIAKRNLGSSPSIPLKGLAIGDGWMKPSLQTGDQIEYAFMLGLIDTLQREAAQSQYKTFLQLIESGKMADAFKVGDALSTMLVNCGGGENIYDVRSWSDASIAPLRAYLSSALVKRSIHVPPETEWKFADAAGPVSDNLINDMMASMTDILPPLVDFKGPQGPAYKMLFYSGNFDMSCGFTGTEQILRAMKWSHQAEWQRIRRLVWFQPQDNNTKQSLGCLKSLQNLMQIEIPMSGHQVPMYQPMVSRQMIYNWIFGRKFLTYDPLQP